MRAFAALYDALDAQTATRGKLDALRDHLAAVPPADAAWAVYLLAGGKPRQAVPTAQLRAAALEATRLPEWLFEECYQTVGDLAETIAHVLPAELLPRRDGASPPDAGLSVGAALVAEHGLARWMVEGLVPLREQPPEAQRAWLRAAWAVLVPRERFLLTKLVGGGFRVGVSRLMVERALAEHAGLPAARVAERMVGYTQARRLPTAQDYERLIAPEAATGDAAQPGGRPYPFFLAHPLEAGDVAVATTRTGIDAVAMAQRLGPVSDWLVEWKYDGIRAQLVRREAFAGDAGSSADGVWIWSRGEELVTDRFPEVVSLAKALPPGTVLDGELLVWREGEAMPAPFADLQPRINRQALSRKLLKDSPVRFLAYDLLEQGGADVRGLPQFERRARLQALLAEGPFAVSPALQAPDWTSLAEQRATSRDRGVEGLMLKHGASRYGIGRRKAEALAGSAEPVPHTWWKWKVAPLTVDAVLVYAQRGHGRRASVYTDYTFAVWNREPQDQAEVDAVLDAIARREPPQPEGLHLVTFAKAYSGLADAEFAEVDRVIRASTVEQFGPVRSVVPSLVFELGFEGLQRSPRHKSGIATRFPRMLRIRHDKPLREADTLPALLSLLP